MKKICKNKTLWNLIKNNSKNILRTKKRKYIRASNRMF